MELVKVIPDWKDRLQEFIDKNFAENTVTVTEHPDRTIIEITSFSGDPIGFNFMQLTEIGVIMNSFQINFTGGKDIGECYSEHTKDPDSTYLRIEVMK